MAIDKLFPTNKVFTVKKKGQEWISTERNGDGESRLSIAHSSKSKAVLSILARNPFIEEFTIVFPVSAKTE